MHKHIYIYFLLAFLFLGCQDDLPSAQDFPIILTLEPGNVDETGVTFRGEVLQEGLTETISYGFVWDIIPPSLDNSPVIPLGKNPSKGIFEARLDSGIVRGLTYYVRAFASYPDKTVYGESISLVSEGSAKGPLSIFIENFTTGAGGSPYASATDETGSLIFPNSVITYFDPASNTFTEGNLFPEPPRTDRRFGSVSIGNTQYFVNTLTNNLYRLENGTWTLITQTPINFFSKFFYFLHATVDKIYLLGISGRVDSYVYDISNNTWNSISGIPADNTGIVSSGFSQGEIAYVLTKDQRFWQYTPSTDTWTQRSDFPGETKGNLMAAKSNNKFYIGFSHTTAGVKINKIDSRLFTYDTGNDNWIRVSTNIIFPERGQLYHFTLQEKLYVGNIDQGTHTVWSYGL